MCRFKDLFCDDLDYCCRVEGAGMVPDPSDDFTGQAKTGRHNRGKVLLAGASIEIAHGVA